MNLPRPVSVLFSLLFALMAPLPALQAMAPDLPHPYTREDPYTNLYGDPTRGPEPDPDKVVYPLTAWDEARAQANCNQGNPYTDTGHFRLKDDAWRSPYVIEEGNNDWDMEQSELDAAAALFSATTDWQDGSDLKYQVLSPPAGATMPSGGWPLVVYCPGSGAVGRDSFVSWTVSDEVIWGSSYFREHYPAYVLVMHPQGRTVRYPDTDNTTVHEPFIAYLELVDDFVGSNPVDPNRIYTHGFSMGGSTVWRLAIAAEDASLLDSAAGPLPEVGFRIAALAPAAGRPVEAGNTAEANAIKDKPIWMFIGNRDPWSGSSNYIRAFQDLIDAGATQVRFWEVQDRAHDDAPMRMFHLAEWMFAQELDQTVPAEAPTVLEHPVSKTVTEGSSASFTASFTGVPFPMVQWQKDGAPIDGATDFTHTLDRVSLADAGAYTAVATNAEGSAETDAAVLSVTPDTTPPSVESAASVSATKVVVLFSEPVAEGTGPGGAENLANYSFSPSLTPTAAHLLSDGRSMELTVGPMALGTTYLLTITDVEDRAATPNALASTQASVTYGGKNVVLIDFNDPAPAPDGNWNRVPNATSVTDLTDFESGLASSLGLSFSGDINGSSSNTQAWDDRTAQPDWATAEVLADRFFLYDGDSGTMTLTGLTPGVAYDIELASGYGGDGSSGDGPAEYELTGRDGLVEGYNALTDASLGTTVSWTPRGTAFGGVEGWLAWYGAVADTNGELTLSITVPDASGRPRGALNALRIATQMPDTPPSVPHVAAALGGGSDLVMTFVTENGRSYVLEQNTDPADPAGWTEVSGQSVSGDGSEHSLTGPAPTGSGAVFYRIRID